RWTSVGTAAAFLPVYSSAYFLSVPFRQQGAAQQAKRQPYQQPYVYPLDQEADQQPQPYAKAGGDPRAGIVLSFAHLISISCSRTAGMLPERRRVAGGRKQARCRYIFPCRNAR